MEEMGRGKRDLDLAVKKYLFIGIFQNRESMCDILVGTERPCLFKRDYGSQFDPSPLWGLFPRV